MPPAHPIASHAISTLSGDHTSDSATTRALTRSFPVLMSRLTRRPLLRERTQWILLIAIVIGVVILRVMTGSFWDWDLIPVMPFGGCRFGG